MFLLQLVERYTLDCAIGASDSYREQLLVAVRLYCRFLGQNAKLADCTDDNVNHFCQWLLDNGRRHATAIGRRNSILTLWRYAYALGATNTFPARIRRIRSPHRVVRAWSIDEVRVLLFVAMNDDRQFTDGQPCGLWFGSLISSAWDSALRLGDLLLLNVANITASQQVIRMNKTGDEVVIKLSIFSVKLIQQLTELTQAKDKIWPLWGRREAFYRRFASLVERAGITKGTFRWIRRGRLSAIAASGADASLAAGHRSQLVTVRHYLDRSKAAAPPAQPLGTIPELERAFSISAV